MSRPLVAHINLSALRHNYRLACQQAPNSQVMAIVKANAYGHGAVAVALALQDLAPMFGVACLEEALELRQAGIQQPLILLEGFFCASEIEQIFASNLEVAVHSSWQLEALEKFFQTQKQAQPWPRIWLKLDSGMHRLGFAAAAIPAAYKRLKQLATEVVITSHLASADAKEPEFVQQQLDVCLQLQLKLGCSLSLANSPFTLNLCAYNSQAATNPQLKHKYVRPGIMLYGSSPFTYAHSVAEKLQPVMTLTSQLISWREIPAGAKVGYGGRWQAKKPTRIGVVACGYGDGYPRQAEDGTPVLVNGKLCSLVGRVSMDMLCVDLTNCPEAQIGSEVTLWGEGLPATSVAEHCSTISYTLFTGLMPRVPRIYKN